MVSVRILFLCLFSLAFSLHAQKQGRERIDSIVVQLSGDLHDTTRVRMMNRVSLELGSISLDSSKYYAEKALELSERLNWKPGITGAWNAMGLYHIHAGNYPDAISLLNKALETNEEIGNSLGSCVNLMNLGIAYSNLQDQDQAIGYYKRSLKLALPLKRNDLIALNSLNLGKSYLLQKKYDSSEFHIRFGLQYTSSSVPSRERAYLFKNLGRLYLERRMYPQAESALQQAVALNRNLGLTSEIAGAYYMLGALFNHKAEQSEGAKRKMNQQIAMTFLQQAMTYFAFPGSKIELGDASHELAKSFASIGNFDSAYRYLEQYVRLHDSLNSLDFQRKIAHLEIEKTLAIQKSELMQEKSLRHRNSILFVTGFVMLTLFLFVIIRERRKAERLLLNILPEQIANRLKRKEEIIVDQFEEVSILFVDIAGFTPLVTGTRPEKLVQLLNHFFSRLDELCELFGVEKIKTIGDCYMAVAGLPTPRTDHARVITELAFAIQHEFPQLVKDSGYQIGVRMGVDCGPVIAGVIGKKKFTYDLWGDAVNTASRMESSGSIGMIHCTDRFRHKLQHLFNFEDCGMHEIKGKGMMQTWFIHRLQEPGDLQPTSANKV